ncbi:MAG: porin [Pseudomonadota bacterium]
MKSAKSFPETKQTVVRVLASVGLITAMPAFAQTEIELLKKELAEQKQLIQSLLKAHESQKQINAKVEAQSSAGGKSATARSETAIPGLTFYGVVDVNVASTNSGFGSKISVGSGGMTATSIGVKGERDLGNGLKAVGELEAAVALDTGTVSNGAVIAGVNRTSPSSGAFVGTGSQIFARQAYAGLSGGLGALTFGRQYTGSYIAAIWGSSMGVSFFGNGATLVPLIGGLPTRVNNSIVYKTPTLNGFSGHITYTTGSENNVSGNVAVGATTTNDKAGRGWDAGLFYRNGPIYAVLSSWNGDNTSFATAGETGLAKKTGWIAAANYDFGVMRLHGTFVSGKISGGNYENVTKTLSSASGASISASVPFGKSTVYVSYARINDKSLLDRDGNLIGLAYTYQLYPNTHVYASWGRQSNNNNSTYGLADSADLVGNVTTAGFDPSGAMAGINVRF